MSGDPREEKWCHQGNFKMAGDKGHTEDKEVQVTLLSGQLVTRACGPPWDEKSGVTWGQAGPSLDLKGSRCRAVASSASSACAVTTGPQEADANGAKGDEARLQNEQETPRCSMQQGQSQRSLSRSLQVCWLAFPPALLTLQWRYPLVRPRHPCGSHTRELDLQPHLLDDQTWQRSEGFCLRLPG